MSEIIQEIYGDDTVYDIIINDKDNKIEKILRKSDNSVVYENGKYIKANYACIKWLSCCNSKNKLHDFELNITCGTGRYKKNKLGSKHKKNELESKYEEDESENKYKPKLQFSPGYRIENIRFYATQIINEPGNIFYETYYKKIDEFFTNNNVRLLFFHYNDLNDFGINTEIKDMHIKYKLLYFFNVMQKYDIVVYFYYPVAQHSSEYVNFKNKILTGYLKKIKVTFGHAYKSYDDIGCITGYLNTNNIMPSETCFINMSATAANHLYDPSPNNITFEQNRDPTYIYTTILFNSTLVQWHNFTNDVRFKPLFVSGHEDIHKVIVIDDDEKLKQLTKCFTYSVPVKTRFKVDRRIFAADVLILTDDLSKIGSQSAEPNTYYRKRT